MISNNSLIRSATTLLLLFCVLALHMTIASGQSTAVAAVHKKNHKLKDTSIKTVEGDTVGTIEEIPDPSEQPAFDIAPEPLSESSPQPEYPDSAKLLGKTGKIIVQGYVDRYGNMKAWKIVRSDPKGMGFEDAVEKVLPSWKFSPALHNGDSVGVWIYIPFNFKFKQ